jgi:hypothetical protein
MNSFRHSKAGLSLLLIFAVLGHFGLGHREASAFVLCFGADGHVAVERAGHDHRVPQGIDSDKVSPKKTESGVYLLTGGDAPCIDIPIVGENHGSHVPLADLTDRSADPELLLTLVFLVFLIPFTRAVPRTPPRADPPIVDSRLLALRSVVLLI